MPACDIIDQDFNLTGIEHEDDGSIQTGKLSVGTFGSAALLVEAPNGLADGETLVITTDGTYDFGAGPSNVRFEDFSTEGLAEGQVITPSNSQFDERNEYYDALLTSDSRSGGLAMMGVDEIARRTSQLRFLFEPVTEVFLSYAVKIPTGKYFPGSGGAGNSGTDADYPTDSSWKITWLQDGSSTANDLCIPTHVGHNGNWYVAGNGLSNKLDSGDLGGKAPRWFGHNNWTRIASHIKAGATPNVDTGNVYFSAVTNDEALFEASKDVVVFEGTNPLAPYQFSNLNFAGWFRNGEGGSDGAGSDVQFLFDDIYLATGDNAAARIELGNNAVYEDCTDLAICQPESWAANQIDFTIKSGGFSLSESLWLHITLADNQTRYSVQVN